MAVPKTIADDLLGELNRFATQKIVPDAFTSARLKREIGKLANADFMTSLLCEAILATITLRKGDTIRKFEEILRYQPEDADTYQNFGHSLLRFQDVNGAHSCYMKALEHSEKPSQVISDLADTAQIIFRPTDLTRALDKYGESLDITSLYKNDDFAAALKLAQLFERLKVDEGLANQIYTSAEKVFIRRNVRVNCGYFRLTGAFGGSKLTFYANIEGDSDFVSETNIELADQIIDDDHGAALPEVSMVFVPYHPSSTQMMREERDAVRATYADN